MRSRLPFLLLVIGLLLPYTRFKFGQVFAAARKRPKAARLRGLMLWLAAVLSFVLLLTWQFIYRSHEGVLESGWFTILAWVSGVGMGLLATFWIFSLPLDLVSVICLRFRSFMKRKPTDPTRREIVTRWVPTAVLGLSGVTTALGLTRVIQGPKVVEVHVPIPRLRPALEGLRIAQISDLHVGPTISREYVENVVAQVLALKPDLIAVTGDLADGSVENLEHRLAPLASLRAPLGAFFVTGNHEYYWGAEKMIEKMRQLGLTPLINENRVVNHQGASILVGGVTDTSSDQHIASHVSSPEKAMQGAPPEAGLKLLLAHRPDSCVEANRAGFDLQLSGHTHAGQFFPWNLIVSRALRFYRGLNREGNLWVYTNAGTGYWGPPNRFTVPSEITLVVVGKA